MSIETKEEKSMFLRCLDEASKALDKAQAAFQETKERFLDVVCPLKEGQAVVVDDQTVFTADKRCLEKTTEGVWEWSVQGRRCSYAKDPMGKTTRVVLNEQDCQAILANASAVGLSPESVVVAAVEKHRILRREQKENRSLSKPLSLDSGQRGMLGGFKDGCERMGFDRPTRENPVKIPRGFIWKSESTTQRIWASLVSAGVLEVCYIVDQSGEKMEEKPEKIETVDYQFWRVAAGPRYDEAIELLRAEAAAKTTKKQTRARPSRGHSLL